MARSHVILRRAILGATILGCIRPEVASPQWRHTPRATESAWSETRTSDLFQQVPPQTDVTNSVIIAALGSAAGILVGGLLGASIDAARDVASEDLSGLIYGALAGSALLSPTLLYLANDRQGPLGRALLLSVTATSLGTLALWPHDAVLLAVPAIQIGVSVALLH